MRLVYNIRPLIQIHFCKLGLIISNLKIFEKNQDQLRAIIIGKLFFKFPLQISIQIFLIEVYLQMIIVL